MNYGIGNVKGKSGGAIPTITISMAQMQDFTTIQLTQEQLDILESNNFINFVDVSGFSYAMIVKSQAEIGNTITFSSGIEEYNGAYTYMQLFVNKTTLVATFEEKSIQASSSQPSLYQHTVRVYQAGSYAYTLTFITEDNTKITADTWETYWANHLDLVNVYLQCSGFSSNKPISGFKIIVESGYYKQGIFTDNDTSVNWGWNAGSFKADEVIQISGATNTPAINDGGIGKK